MDLINYIILGIIEGITEFLPISSTAHLILVSKLLNIPQTDFHKFFEIFIQSGAILAVITIYFKILTSNKELVKKLILSFLPTAFISIIFYNLIKNFFFENEILIIFMLIFMGLIFILTEFLIKKGKIKLTKSMENLSYWQAVLIGVFQSLAIIPGVSRAGAVILGMIILKFKREDSVIYSFLLAIPTIISAGIYDLYKVSSKNNFWLVNNFYYLLIGFGTAFIFALITIKWFINFLRKNDLSLFGYYRIILGLIILLNFI